MQIKWLKKALRNLEQAYAVIAKDDPEAAVRTILKIEAAVRQLSEFSNLGRVGQIEGTRELVISKTPFIVVYRVKGKTVQVIRVLHGARKYPD
jgi:toxin ParE1/3/4